MRILTNKVLLKAWINSLKTLTLAFHIKAHLLVGLFLFQGQTSGQESFKIAVLDTGFCPHLLEVPENIVINPVKDISQSNDYECSKSQLAQRRYHGQWVLEVLTKNLKPKKSKLIIQPYIIFNKFGEQKLGYWKKAFKDIDQENMDLIIAAAGLPLSQKISLKDQAKLTLPDISLFLAAGRAGPKVPKESFLYPQDLGHLGNTLIFGTYHPKISKNTPAFSDPALLRPEEIDYYLPYKGNHASLKGTSLAVALAGHIFLNNCPWQKNITFKEIEACLQGLRYQEKLKKKQEAEPQKVWTLKSSSESYKK